MAALSEKTASQSSLMESDESKRTGETVDGEVERLDGEGGLGKEKEEKEEKEEEEDHENAENVEQPLKTKIFFKLAYGRKVHDICAVGDQKVVDFQKTVFELTNVAPAMQKLLCKGMKLEKTPEKTLIECKLNGSKILLVGSTMEEIVSASTKPSAQDLSNADTASSSKEPLCKQKMHTKIVDQGVPDDALPGIKNAKDPLPGVPLKGMRNKAGRPVRLTFKLELDQLWISTPERTDKIPMGQISDVVSEPIVGKEEYSIIGIGVGTTEASRIWVYWVPTQFVAAIRKALLD